MTHPGWICLVVFLLSATNLAFAADLLETYALARNNDAEIRAAEFELQASLEAKPQSRSALLPQVAATAGRTQNDTSSTFSATRTTDYSLTLSQSVYNRANWVRLEQADASIAQAEVDLEAAELALILRVAEAYFSILEAQDTLEFARAEKDSFARQLEQAEKRFEVGLIAITDVKEAQAGFDRARADQIAAENALANSREALQVITNEDPESLSILAEELPLVRPDPEDIEEWVKVAEMQNRAYLATKFATEVAQQSIEISRSGHYPTLDLEGGYEDQQNSGGFAGSGRGASVSLRLNLPLYTGGNTSSLVREARATYEAAREQLESERRVTVQQTRDSYRNVIDSISAVQALRQALESAQTAADATQAGFEVGTRTSVDVAVALRNTFEAQRNYAQTRYRYLLETLRLKQASGTLTETDLEQINQWLQASPTDSDPSQ